MLAKRAVCYAPSQRRKKCVTVGNRDTSSGLYERSIQGGEGVHQLQLRPGGGGGGRAAAAHHGQEAEGQGGQVLQPSHVPRVRRRHGRWLCALHHRHQLEEAIK